jgi:mycofactocin precursor
MDTTLEATEANDSAPVAEAEVEVELVEEELLVEEISIDGMCGVY